ncbi:regulatory LuxR family protein [Kribbella orskensis]|uniref:Regulatory LuxR family protein n=1 Tax=Kribbella orskensis TaxID=2512216 RepID=A0ABY2B751_9ACTN|nr:MULTISPECIES: helix-turn-helix transcriptional regulator [Kribbella]TCN28860.1 regulatory LuxR family protein [Kribbella sp. VKM Ac-2500]TCO08970.1 regulatory LuxR family protein [Kribbella orskensis]
MGVSRGGPDTGLLDRRVERGAVDRVLDRARAGNSAVLVVRGEPGIGKTVVLDYAANRASASDLRVVRVWGVESELELAYAALHQLCVPLIGRRMERLPRPQRDALAVAFGMQEGPAPDRFLVGLAVLSLLAATAEDQPLACVVDDAQWLDRASVQCLAFAARRLLAEPIALIFAVRGPGDDQELAGLPGLTVTGLGNADARTLLATAIGGRLDAEVRDRVLAETRGNPLALLQLPRGLGPAQLAGGFWLPDPRPLASRIEDSFHRQFQSLPPQTQRLLLTAAADPTGAMTLLWRAAGLQGIQADAAAAAETVGLVEFGAGVHFGHPLVRSAVYQAASAGDRREAHRALAEATDPKADPDRRAWHRAHAAIGPDEEVAAELESSAGRAQARGGLAAAAAFLERAAALTPDPVQRADRALAAAQAKVQAGAFDAAVQLLGLAEAAPLDEFQRARVDLLRAQLAFATNRGSEAPQLLMRAAKRLEAIDAGLARETYLDALNAALFAGRLASPGGWPQDVSQAARAAPRPPHPPRPHDLLLDGLAANFSEGHAAGLPLLRRALSGFDRETSAEEDLRWLWLANIAAVHLWDYDRWDTFSSRHVRLTREAGALSELPLALIQRAYALLFAGELAAAASLVEEVQVVTEATGSRLAPYGDLALAALRGREGGISDLATATKDEVVQRGEGLGIGLTDWAIAVFNNGVGHYQSALAAAEDASEYLADVSVTVNWGLVELVEAAVRCGLSERATDAVRRLSESTSASGGDWALGVEARSRALLSEGETADRLYREAIERLGRTRMGAEVARAHLLYGEWLRRESRRVDAREQLHVAYEMLAAMGMEGFADRARRELQATGETVRKHTVETLTDLTAQEAQIAKLARSGRTNQEIGGQLFISPRTVEWHLGNVFAKLGITSRKDLR